MQHTLQPHFESETHFQQFNLRLLCCCCCAAHAAAVSSAAAACNIEGQQQRQHTRARATALVGHELQLNATILLPCHPQQQASHSPPSSPLLAAAVVVVLVFAPLRGMPRLHNCLVKSAGERIIMRFIMIFKGAGGVAPSTLCACSVQRATCVCVKTTPSSLPQVVASCKLHVAFTSINVYFRTFKLFCPHKLCERGKVQELQQAERLAVTL